MKNFNHSLMSIFGSLLFVVSLITGAVVHAQDMSIVGKQCPADLATYPPIDSNAQCDPDRSNSTACDQRFDPNVSMKEWRACYGVISSCRKDVDEKNDKIASYNTWIYKCREAARKNENPKAETGKDDLSSLLAAQKKKAEGYEAKRQQDQQQIRDGETKALNKRDAEIKAAKKDVADRERADKENREKISRDIPKAERIIPPVSEPVEQVVGVKISGSLCYSDEDVCRDICKQRWRGIVMEGTGTCESGCAGTRKRSQYRGLSCFRPPR